MLMGTCMPVQLYPKPAWHHKETCAYVCTLLRVSGGSKQWDNMASSIASAAAHFALSELPRGVGIVTAEVLTRAIAKVGFAPLPDAGTYASCCACI